MTIKEAIKTARDNVSMHSIGSQYQVNTFDASMNAWRQGISQDYWQALKTANVARINQALSALGHDFHSICAIECDYENDGGKWTSYVKRP